MSKTTKIKEFNSIMETFLNQLSPYVGTSYYYYYKKLIKVNAVLPIQQFVQHVLPYKVKIFEKDESYFKETDNHKDKIQGDEATLTEILRLQNIYYKLDNDSRKEVWTYMQALSILSEEYSLM